MLMIGRRSGSGRPGQRVRRRARGGGVRLGLLLRLRVRLSGLVGLLVRSVEELRCSSPTGSRIGSCSTPPGARKLPALRHGGPRRYAAPPAERNVESSFYAEAIADCLEFIKSRSS